MAGKLRLPKFANEAEEAQWWYDHRRELAGSFEKAAAGSELHVGSPGRVARERTGGITPTTTIRLDPGDISRARMLAEKRGLRYQTYLKMLIHETLEYEAKKLRQENPQRRIFSRSSRRNSQR
jgi:hypothetical protein